MIGILVSHAFLHTRQNRINFYEIVRSISCWEQVDISLEKKTREEKFARG